jgi:hypothetical protein
VALANGSTADQVEWYYPVIKDNVAVDFIIQTYEQLERYAVGTYTVVAYVNDTSGNLSPPCSFTFNVIPFDFTTTTTTISTAAIIAAGSSSSSTWPGHRSSDRWDWPSAAVVDSAAVPSQSSPAQGEPHD